MDRNEELHLLQASHSMVAYANSTETEDGTLVVTAEVSASPSRTASTLNGTATISDPVEGGAATDDSIDIVGRRLNVMAGAPFSDAATGVGGAGTAGADRYTTDMFPAEFGRFHPRDELFFNGQIRTWNIDDAGVHIDLEGQHVYGVIAED